MALFEGLLIGLSMVIFIGPVFLLLLNSSLQYGLKAGIAVALGIIISDILCVLMCVLGFSTVVLTIDNQFWLGLLSAIILLVLGFFYLLKDTSLLSNNAIKSKSITALFIKGFSVNFFNPFVFLVWIGVYNYGKTSYASSFLLTVFLSATLFGILITDILKVILSQKLEKFISIRRLYYISKITGLILILFSVRVLWFVMHDLT
ncbi:LysE family translocator [Aquimarina agarivorans]|uniref:LysE family translocator n=1 Tax=Aquimarina agarivorans TaxID=980584 RepID=UPI000248E96C|nr:LysE family transporter [Aquimarina agarivorans]